MQKRASCFLAMTLAAILVIVSATPGYTQDSSPDMVAPYVIQAWNGFALPYGDTSLSIYSKTAENYTLRFRRPDGTVEVEDTLSVPEFGARTIRAEDYVYWNWRGTVEIGPNKFTTMVVGSLPLKCCQGEVSVVSSRAP